MSERVEHPYECSNKGCSNGYLSTFYGAPPEWYASKGLSEPKNCPACREWKKAQTDSKYRCQSCGYAITQRRGAKLHHHKKEGVYTPPTVCMQCQDGKKQAKSTRRFKQEPVKKLDSTPVDVLNIVDYKELSAYRRNHYGKHIVGHPRSEVGQPMRNGKPVSATTLVGTGATSIAFYTAVSEIARRTDNVYQYRQGKNKVIKATVVNGTHVEMSVFELVEDGTYELITSYDAVEITEVKKKLEEKKWQ